MPRIRAFVFKAAVAIAAAGLALGIPEIALRLAGFHYESGVEFAIPETGGEFITYRPHADLLFTFDPAHPKVNEFGFPDRRVELPKPEGTFRILFLGDSCTQQGFPDRVASKLSGDDGRDALRVDAVTLAVAGYSSYQGRVLARDFAPRMDGDLAVVYFGWNDHWLASAPDAQRISVQTEMSQLQRFVRFLSQKSRLFQLLMRLRMALSERFDPASARLRVPIDDYRANLEEIHERLASQGMRVVFVTAPTTHYYFGAPTELVRAEFAADTESVPRLHRSYNQVVRKVAAARGALLLDLERDFGKLSPRKLKTLFSDDGVHFSEAGLRNVTRRIARFLREQGLLPRSESAEDGVRGS